MFESESVELEAALAWLVSFTTFIMLSAVLGCVCGCRKNADKEDWLGREGKLKQLNVGLEDDRLLRIHLDNNRASANTANRASTANRSLPDIPTNEVRDSDPPWDSTQQTTSDNCSELYATVGDVPQLDSGSTSEPSASGKPTKKRQAPSAPDASQLESTLPDSKISHQYAKLTHPYARVKPPPPKSDNPNHASSSTMTRSIELESSETTPEIRGGSETTLSSSTDQPVPPPRTRRSSSQSNLYLPSSPRQSSSRRSTNTLPSTPSSSSSSESSSKKSHTIAAAPAILGHISASQELPYITLPIANNSSRHQSVPSDLPTRAGSGGSSNAIGLRHGEAGPAVNRIEDGSVPGGGHFSGDSQDSSKGYTSISVREPLASIRAQTSQVARRLDSHYATVSDDSDEMYAAIDDRSGSETYAQIVPPPPSVDSLKTRVAENHSRQTSSSSAASSVVNVGSPKPEKRQANSPLPPPPLVPPPPPSSSPPSTPTPVTPVSKATLEEMYAKVVKKKASTGVSSIETPPSQPERISPDLSINLNNINPGYESLNSAILPPILSEPNYESVTTVVDLVPGYESVVRRPPSSNDPGYELVRNNSQRSTDPNYEMVRNSAQRNSDPNYESVRNSSRSSVDPNYESVRNSVQRPTDPNYESVRNSSRNSADPNYESVSNSVRPTDPNYEELRGQVPIIEPNYEMLLNGEPSYEPLTNNSSSDEPNYESVGGLHDPPYERLAGEASPSTNDILYATVNKVKKSSEQ